MYTEEFQNLDNTAEKADVYKIIQALLSCDDVKYINEIYAERSCISNNHFNNWIGLVIELNEGFVNKDLYDTMDDIDENKYCFQLNLSCEPNDMERGKGIVLWKRR